MAGLVDQLNKIIPLVGDANGSILGDDITTGTPSGLTPLEEEAICSAVQDVSTRILAYSNASHFIP